MVNINRISDFFSTVGENIYKNAEEAVKRHGMDEAMKSGVLLGLSGGADSVMLLCFLMEYRLRNSLSFPIACVHINHGIRGDDADHDENFCRTFCAALRIELIVEKFDIPAIAKETKLGIEEAARNIRYSSFDKIISGRNDISVIAVAHNMSDNAETVIFNILRGCGTRGASGIRPHRGNIIRPLLYISKSDITSAMDEYGLEYVTDESNFSNDYTRNFIRNEIIPKLNSLCDSPDRAIMRFSENMRSDDEFLSSLASEFLASHPKIYNRDLRALHFSLFIRVLSAMANAESGIISSSVASDVYLLLEKDNFSYSIGKGASFICERGICSISFGCDKPLEYSIIISSEVTDLAPFDADFLISDRKFDKTSLNIYKKAIQADISSAIINGSLFFRQRMDGDTIYYGGMTHKIKKIFCDRKIPLSLRNNIPILCDEKGIVWVPGVGVRDDRLGHDEATKLFVAIGIRDDSDECPIVIP